MITTDYVLQMARYNAWQNGQLRQIVKTMDRAALTADRGAFFGSIQGTLNHILWADTLWMCRWCSDVAAPAGEVADSPAYCRTIGEWDAARFALDGRLRIWAQTLSNVDLVSEERWFSKVLGRQQSQPLQLCVMHLFNHQAHHRGQVSQMLHAAGVAPPVSDLIFMPETA